jgi:flavin reductase (DIM6/NTAB) family NADH-FMN oxidoreductase RutF
MMIEFLNPRETIMVSCRAEMTILGKKVVKDNLITLNWHMPVSFQPSLLAIALAKNRYSLKIIQRSRLFCVNLIPLGMEKAAVFCGSYSGEHMDKFSKAGLEKTECSRIECPAIKGSVAHIECQVENEIIAGDHVIIIGKVLSSEKHSDEKRLYNLRDRIFTEI